MHEKPHALLLHVGDALGGAAHTVPQFPQFEVSAWRFTHEPLQLVVLVGQDVVHWPPEHT